MGVADRARQLGHDRGGPRPWCTIEEVELATAEWVDWFARRRLYEYCGDIHRSN